MTIVYVIRHAEKERGDFFNPRLRHQDEPISTNGRLQAERVAAYLAGKPVAAIYVSGYVRTSQTAAPAAQALGLAPVIDERLNEIDNGCIDKLSDEQLQRQYPEIWAAFRKREADFRFPEGETGEEVRRRVSEFLEEKRLKHPDETIAIVVHDGLIRILMCHILGLPVYCRWNFAVDFCGITEIRYQPEWHNWKLMRFNHTC